MSLSILTIEDDSSLATWIQAYLSHHDFDVNIVSDGNKAVDAIRDQQPDIVVLDVMLPGMNGFEICQQAREFYDKPIIMLTACSEEEDELKGFELGVTDFLAKPVRPKILLARINSLLQRREKQNNSDLIFDDLIISPANKSIQLGGGDIEVTAAEFDLIWCLARHAGQIVSRDTLLKNRRGIEYDGLDRSIDIAVSRMRKKLGDTNPASKIKTIRSKGYLFAANVWALNSDKHALDTTSSTKNK